MEEAKKKINWSFQALEHVVSIEEYISQYNIVASESFVSDLFNLVNETLANFPERNPPCSFPKLQSAGYRCMKFRKKYLVVYKEQEDFINILAVLYAGRDPKIFDDLI